jgi:hypothetical protein
MARKKIEEEIPKELMGLNDRACAIVCAATLEARLEELIRKRLVKGADDALFSGRYGPLSTLAAKVDAAFALGLIAKSEAEDLHRHRKIRNAFAHERHELSFARSPILDHVKQLHYLGSRFLRREVPEVMRDYQIAVISLWGLLNNRIRDARRLREADDHGELFAQARLPPPRKKKGEASKGRHGPTARGRRCTPRLGPRG